MWFRKLFKKRRLAVVVDTNVPLYYLGDIKEGSILKKLKGRVFVPWVVMSELFGFFWIKEKDQRIREINPDELDNFINNLPEEGRRMREIRSRRIGFALPFVQKMIEQGKWQLIGSNGTLEPYLKAFNGRADGVGESDARILATCFLLAETGNFKKIVLLTRDKELARLAESFGIRVESGLGGLV